MKIRPLPFVLFTFISINICAQIPDTIKLSSPFTGTQDKVAKKAVFMLPGFSYTATTGNTFTARIAADGISDIEYLTGTRIPNPDTRQLNTSFPVGSVQGNSSVTQLGGLSYSIPIFCSPGTNGVQPSISVQYNSQSGNGVFSWGWNLAGLSAITRVVKPYYADNNVKSINMVTDDEYAIDGNRLILISGSGTQGSDGSKYNTELESFTTTTIHETAGNGPSWFDVYNKKDGSVMEYGKGTDAYIDNAQNTRLIWFLTKFQDVNGNYIKYNYKQGPDLNQVYLSSIQYTGNTNTGLQPYNEIVFKYATRPDGSTQFQGGIEMYSNLIITEISCLNEEDLVKKYSFDYAYNYYTDCSQLVSITETSGIDNSYNSTIFKYFDDTPISESATSYFTTTGTNEFCYADFNGDGESDMAIIPVKEAYSSSDKIKIYFNQNGTDFQFIQNIDISPYSIDLGDDGIYYFGKFHGGNVVDFDGNGKCDFYTIETIDNTRNPFWDPDDNPVPVQNIIKYYLSDGSGLSFHVWEPRSAEWSMVPGDMDGDGMSDSFTFTPDGNQYSLGLSRIAYNLLSPFGQIISGSLSAGQTWSTNTGPIEFNGDGKAEIYSVDDNSYLHIYGLVNNLLTELITPFYFDYDKYCFGDINGDGKTDIFAYQTSITGSVYTAFFSTGKGFTLVDFPHVNLFTAKFDIADLNGDGKGELIHEISSNVLGVWSTEIYAYYYDGENFTTGVFSYNYFSSDNIIAYTDLNGDGQNELFARPRSTGTVNYSSIKRNRPYDKSRLLSTVSDGLNNILRISYGCLPSSTSYSTSSVSVSPPVIKLKVPIYIVENVKNYGRDESTPFSNISYTYQDFRIHIRGKGALGFYKVTIDDVVSTAKTETEYSYGNTFFNVYPSKIKQYQSSTLLSETTNTLPVIHSFDSNHRYFAYVPNTITENKPNGTKIEIASTVDNSGNLTAKTTKYKSQSGSIIKQITESYSTFDNFGNPQNISVTSTRDAISITRTKSIQYYPTTGLLKKVTQNFSPSPSVETSYTYDSFGNMLTETNSWNGLSRAASSVYESDKGRFIISKTNPINHSVFYSTNPAFGLTLKDSTQTGMVTSYDYDDFGHLTATHYPAGNVVNKSRLWSLGAEGVGETFYETISSQNSPTTKTYFDYAGREKRSKTQSFNGTYLVTDKIYDSKQRLYRKYLPYFEGSSANEYVEYAYDAFNRILSETKVPGTIITSYAYYDSELKTKITKGGQDYYRQNDASGLLYKATDPGGTITYNYNAENKIKSILSPSGEMTIDYDDYGFQDKLHDLDAGTIDYDYNGYGELKQQIDNNGNIVKFDYDNLGRMTQKAWTGGETITYAYHPTNELLTNVSSNGTGYVKNIAYDNLNRISSRSESFDGNTFTVSYNYNQKGEITNTLLNSTVSIVNLYNNYGFPSQITVNNQTIWTANSMDKYSQVNNFTLGNQTTTTLSYDQYGFLDKLTTTRNSTYLQNWDYDFNYLTGNLSKRKGLNSSGALIEESFPDYDQLSRLKTSTIGANTINVNYDINGLGNIINKTDVGTYDYTENLHNVANILNPTSVVQSMPQQQISYTKFNKVSYIKDTYVSGEQRELFITYGTGEERIKTIYKVNNVAKKTKYFALGSYEKETDNTTGISRELFYIGSPSGIVAVLEKKNSTSTIYYIHTDHLGSFDVVSNPDGTVKERYKFDPWGRRRNPADWSYNNISSSFFLDRGFTGHEHLDQFALINMNGRVYDPALAMFLSPDNYVQNPDLTTNFNRYSYCLNNPLIYTDPDGEWFITALITLANMWLSTSAANDFEFNPLKWDWGSPKTWVTLGQSAFSGYKIGSSAEDYVNDKIMDFRINRLEKKFESINSPNYTASLQDGVYNQVDGLFIKNEKLAYNFIWNESIRNGKEYGAFITPNGVLVTPTYLNTEASGTIFGYYQTTWEGKSLFVNTTKAKYQVIGALHTHQMENSFYGYYFSGDDEWTTIALKGLPHFVLNRDNTVFAQYAGFIDKDKSWYCFPLKFNNSRNDVLNGFSLIKFILNGN